MRNYTFGFLRGIAVLVGIAVVCSLLLSRPTATGVQREIITLPETMSVTTLNGPHPPTEVRRLLNMNDSNGFYPDIASILRREVEGSREAGQTRSIHQQVASVSHDQKGGFQ